MDSRTLGRTARTVSVISLGTWQLGGDWGTVTEADARAVLTAAVESGVTMFDTADVYGDGRSEQLIGGYLADNPCLDIFVATKIGRRADQVTANYTIANFREWIDRSRSTCVPTPSTSCSCTARPPPCSRATRCSTGSTHSSRRRRSRTTV